MNNNVNVIQNNKGRNMYRVFHNGVDYGFMTAKARREFFVRHAAK
ncbi:hypothetical protein SEA_SANASANA_16 [Microbacterium phage SanaSana]|nr:hypothetical protein QDW21_gp15 [Microbacterium phage Stoor]QUE26055.1 hypothetical protein SEA_STOOR_15 [Microbacterium phage Stoor]